MLCWMRALRKKKDWQMLKCVADKAKDVLQEVKAKSPGASSRGDLEFLQWEKQVLPNTSFYIDILLWIKYLYKPKSKMLHHALLCF